MICSSFFLSLVEVSWLRIVLGSTTDPKLIDLLRSIRESHSMTMNLRKTKHKFELQRCIFPQKAMRNQLQIWIPCKSPPRTNSPFTHLGLRSPWRPRAQPPAKPGWCRCRKCIWRIQTVSPYRPNSRSSPAGSSACLCMEGTWIEAVSGGICDEALA